MCSVKHKIFIASTLFCIAGCVGNDKREPISKNELPDSLIFQPCDLVFRRGIGFSSEMILAVEKSSFYSHIGIVVEQDKNLYVVHATPGEDSEELLKIEDIDSFFSQERSIAGSILRYPLDSFTQQKINHQVIRLVQSHIYFDHQFLLSDSLQFYCTELIWRVFNTQNIDISNGQRVKINSLFFQEDIILPQHIFNHPSLLHLYSYEKIHTD